MYLTRYWFISIILVYIVNIMYYNTNTLINLLRRVNNGDETVLKEIDALLNYIDEEDAKLKEKEAKRKEALELKKTRGRKNSGAFEIAPRYENGVDYGNTGIVLLKNERCRLVWRSGSQYFAGIGCVAYAPSELVILMPPDGMTRNVKVTDHFKDRGSKKYRLSSKLVLQYKEKIDKIFGEGSTEKAAALKQTVILSKQQ